MRLKIYNNFSKVDFRHPDDSNGGFQPGTIIGRFIKDGEIFFLIDGSANNEHGIHKIKSVEKPIPNIKSPWNTLDKYPWSLKRVEFRPTSSCKHSIQNGETIDIFEEDGDIFFVINGRVWMDEKGYVPGAYTIKLESPIPNIGLRRDQFIKDV